MFIKAGAGRNGINVSDAVNAITKEVDTIIITTYITSDALIEFLKQLKQKYAEKPIAIVLDNAWYQHCIAVKTVAASLDIHLPILLTLIFIECLSRFTKKILYAKYYDKPAEFHNVVKNFVVNINHNDDKEL